MKPKDSAILVIYMNIFTNIFINLYYMYICINKNIVRDFKDWIGKTACKLVGHSKLLMSSPFQLSVHHRFINSKKKKQQWFEYHGTRR